MSSNGALIVDYTQRLPRGRHGIPPDLVRANQCERLLAATATVLAEHGYSALRVSDVVARAGVSRATFYKFFDDKLDVVLAAQLDAYEGLELAMTDACQAVQAWPQRVVATIGAALEYCADSPDQARLLVATGFAQLEPRLASEGISLAPRLLERLQEVAAGDADKGSHGPLRAELAISVAISVVGACLGARDSKALQALRPDLIEIVLTPYLGGEEAKRIALAA